MVKRALLCGLGKSYEQTGSLKKLPLEHDIQLMIERLNSPMRTENWDSIDVVDDSHMSVFVEEKNRVISKNLLMPSKLNLFNSMEDIVEVGTDLLMVYFSGHGEPFGSRLFMITYDESFFNQRKALMSSLGAFMTDEEYIFQVNKLMERNSSLTIISVIDCCFSALIVEKMLLAGKFLDRHIIICSSRNESRTTTELGSFFTRTLVKSTNTAITYSVLDVNLKKDLGAHDPKLYYEAFKNTILQF